jgi:hypothetical protein
MTLAFDPWFSTCFAEFRDSAEGQSDDDPSPKKAAVEKVGPHGYSHGWVHAGEPDADAGQPWDAIERDYGDAIDSAEFSDDGATVAAHDSGTLTVAFPASAEDHFTVFTALDPAEARTMADNLDWALAIDPTDPSYTPDTVDPDTGLIDWLTGTDGGIVGIDPSGDVRIGVPARTAGKLDEVDLSAEDAQRLADGLREMADHADDAGGD